MFEALARRLRKKAVAILNERNLLLKCEACGQVWQPMLKPGGKLHKGYWRCPRDCNASQ